MGESPTMPCDCGGVMDFKPSTRLIGPERGLAFPETRWGWYCRDSPDHTKDDDPGLYSADLEKRLRSLRREHVPSEAE